MSTLESIKKIEQDLMGMYRITGVHETERLDSLDRMISKIEQMIADEKTTRGEL